MKWNVREYSRDDDKEVNQDIRYKVIDVDQMVVRHALDHSYQAICQENAANGETEVT